MCAILSLSKTERTYMCMFSWIGRQVLRPYQTDLLNKALMYPEDF